MQLRAPDRPIRRGNDGRSAAGRRSNGSPCGPYGTAWTSAPAKRRAHGRPPESRRYGRRVANRSRRNAICRTVLATPSPENVRRRGGRRAAGDRAANGQRTKALDRLQRRTATTTTMMLMENKNKRKLVTHIDVSRWGFLIRP